MALSFFTCSENCCQNKKKYLPLASLPNGKGPATDIDGATAGVTVAKITVDVTVDITVYVAVTTVNRAINRTKICAIMMGLLKM